MKANRRHDLQENELARSLGEAVQYMRQNVNWIVGGVVGVLVVAFLVWYGFNQRSVTRQRQWQQYFNLAYAVSLQGRLTAVDAQSAPPRTRDDLTKLAGETSQRNLTAWANIQIGHSAYEELTRRRTDLDAPGVELLATEARQAYGRVIENYPEQSAAVGEAHMALGKLAETLNDLDAARKQYETVLAMESRIGPLTVVRAHGRLTDLDKWAQPIVFPASAPSQSRPAAPLRELTVDDFVSAPPALAPGSLPASAPAGD